VKARDEWLAAKDAHAKAIKNTVCFNEEYEIKLFDENKLMATLGVDMPRRCFKTPNWRDPAVGECEGCYETYQFHLKVVEASIKKGAAQGVLTKLVRRSLNAENVQ
jgi:hypothetical protein